MKLMAYSGQDSGVPWPAHGRLWSIPKPVDETAAGLSGSGARGLAPSARKGNSWPVFLLLIALIVPWVIPLGPIKVSPARLVLMVMLLPCLFMWLTGKAGRIILPDVMLILFSLWSALGLFVLHGPAYATTPAGNWLIETVGAYMVARCYIRDADDFRNAVQLLFKTVLFLMPFAFVEFVSGYNILQKMFALVLPTPAYPSLQRAGFTRVMTVFDHPIMFGVYTGSILGMTYLTLNYRKGFAHRLFKSGVVAATAFMSLSAGPIGGLAMQTSLLAWNEVLRSVRYRWTLLLALVAGLYIVLEIVAKRSALTIMASFFLFDSSSYWYRRLIWDYGLATALNHPLFGVGLNDWERPVWMPANTFDNFWLFEAVRSGFPAAALLLSALIWIIVALGRKKDLDDRHTRCRDAVLITMAFFFLAGWTVHFWGNVYVLFMFLIGSGVWILDSKAPSGATAAGKARDGLALGARQARRVTAFSAGKHNLPAHNLDGAVG